MKIIFTKKSKKDIVDVVQYVSKDNSNIANDIFDKIWYTCNLIANMPEMGTSVNSLIDSSDTGEPIQEIINATKLLKELRRFPVSGFNNLIIFYKAQNNELKIVRILHGSRDMPVIFVNMITDMD